MKRSAQGRDSDHVCSPESEPSKRQKVGGPLEGFLTISLIETERMTLQVCGKVSRRIRFSRRMILHDHAHACTLFRS